MKYIVVSVPDTTDISAAAIGAVANLVIGEKTIAGATVQIMGQGSRDQAAPAS